MPEDERDVPEPEEQDEPERIEPVRQEPPPLPPEPGFAEPDIPEPEIPGPWEMERQPIPSAVIPPAPFEQAIPGAPQEPFQGEMPAIPELGGQEAIRLLEQMADSLTKIEGHLDEMKQQPQKAKWGP